MGALTYDFISFVLVESSQNILKLFFSTISMDGQLLLQHGCDT